MPRHESDTDTDTDTETVLLDPEPDDDFFDEEWMASGSRRSRWRLALLVALSVAVVFLGGVQVQKHFGSSTTETGVAGGFSPGGAMPEGFPDLGGGSGAGSSAGATGSGRGGGDDTSASVIGTVTKVDGDTWIVTDLGGTKHTVTVDGDTVLLEEKSLEDGDVPTGTTVTISGTTGDSDDLTATSITVR